jgi:1-acyl-sn-glycerol-3-phosphate acyltransferase
MIRSLLLLSYLALCIVLALPWLILWTVLTGNPSLMYEMSMKAVRVGNRIAGMRVRVEGLENVPSGACVFVANHASNVDPLAMFPAVPQRLGVLIKKELLNIPILSAGMRRAHFVAVDRGDREAAAGSVDVAVRYLKEGVSFAIFAEGTRSPDGHLRPFKRGGFSMAIEAAVPVVPVSIAGTQRILRKNDWKLHPGEVTVHFGPAIDAVAYTPDRRNELLQRVQSAVAANLPPDQQPTGDSAASANL